MKNHILETISRRRSVREYTDAAVNIADLRQIITAGSWAPSGLNNQPWRFVLICAAAVRFALADQTRYGHIVRNAPALIAVFLDRNAMYNDTKDHQAAGACIQNMLLAAEELGLGAVWLGEILNKKAEVNGILELSGDYDLMAVVAVGHPAHRNQISKRKNINDLIIKEIMEAPS